MGDIRQAFVLEVKGGQAVISLANDVEQAGKKIPPLTDRFDQVTTTTGKFAAAMDTTTSALARSAEAFGLPREPLKAFADVSEVAALGLGNLTKTNVGFNTATLGVAAAAGAAGYALGTLARDHIPGLAAATDKAVEALYRLFTAQADLDRQAGAMKGLADFQTKMAASHAEAQKKQVEMLRTVGKTEAEIIDFLEGKRKTSTDRLVDRLKEEEKARKKAVEEAKKFAKEDSDWQIKKYQESIKFTERYQAALVDVTLTQIKYQEVIGDGAAEKKAAFNAEQLLKKIKEQQAAHEKLIDRWIEDEQRLADDKKRFAEEDAERWNELGEHLNSAAGALDNLDGLFDVLGLSADSTLRKMTQGFADVASAAGGFAKAMASGNIFDQIGAGIGLVTTAIGAVGNVIRDVEWEQVNDLRDDLFEAAGGFDEMNERAHAAGLTLQDVLDAKTVKEYEAAVGMLNTRLEFIESFGGLERLRAQAEEAGVPLHALFDATDAKGLKLAIDDINAALGLWTESNQKVDEAMERWGITVEQLGPKFREQRLHEQAVELLGDWKLLAAAGVDLDLLWEKMGGSINEFVNTSIRTGTTIPEAMRPIIEWGITNRKLLDENGEAYESLEATGITFAESLSESISRLIEKIDAMVNALLGIPSNVGTTVTVTERFVREEDDGGNRGREGFASGGVITSWGVPATLHGTPSNPEFVLQSKQLAAAVAQGVSMAMRSAPAASGSGDGQVIQVNVDGYPIFRLIQNAMRDGKLRVHPVAVTAAGV